MPGAQPFDLLTAAFLDHPDAMAAWQRWSGAIDWDEHLDHNSFSLLPLVYRNLSRLGVDDPLFPRLKGITRQAWLANQRFAVELGPLLAALADDGVELLLLPSLWHLAQDSTVVLNRSAPIRWAVRPEQACTAIHCLLDHGLRLDRVRLPKWSVRGYTAAVRHIDLRDRNGRHWQLNWGLEWWLGERVDSAWENVSWRQVGKHRVRALAAADTLAFELREYVLSGADADAVEPANGIDQRCFALAGRLLRVARSAADNERTIVWYPSDYRVAECLARIEPLLRQYRVHPQQSPGETLPTARTSTAKPLPKRMMDDWLRYRVALGTSATHADSLVQLPGYLMGRWRLQHLHQLPRRLLGWLFPRIQRRTP